MLHVIWYDISYYVYYMIAYVMRYNIHEDMVWYNTIRYFTMPHDIMCCVMWLYHHSLSQDDNDNDNENNFIAM